MSTEPTQISASIADYLYINFSVEDDFIRELKQEALNNGFPDISISSEQGAFLQFILKTINAKNVLEIGSLAGYSAITMARALPDNGKLIAVEMEPVFANFIKEKSKQAGLENKIDVVNSDAISFLKTYNPVEKLDFIFLDAEKTEYMDYFNLSIPHLRKGGIIAADNAFAFGEIANSNAETERHDANEIIAVREFNKAIKNREDFFTTLVPIGDGMLMSVKM